MSGGLNTWGKKGLRNEASVSYRPAPDWLGKAPVLDRAIDECALKPYDERGMLDRVGARCFLRECQSLFIRLSGPNVDSMATAYKTPSAPGSPGADNDSASA